MLHVIGVEPLKKPPYFSQNKIRWFFSDSRVNATILKPPVSAYRAKQVVFGIGTCYGSRGLPPVCCREQTQAVNTVNFSPDSPGRALLKKKFARSFSSPGCVAGRRRQARGKILLIAIPQNNRCNGLFCGSGRKKQKNGRYDGKKAIITTVRR